MPTDATLTTGFKLFRERHPALVASGPHPAEVERVLRSIATIVDSLNVLRNRASLAHPNDSLLGEPEALLVINSVQTILRDLDAKLA